MLITRLVLYDLAIFLAQFRFIGDAMVKVTVETTQMKLTVAVGTKNSNAIMEIALR